MRLWMEIWFLLLSCQRDKDLHTYFFHMSHVYEVHIQDGHTMTLMCHEAETYFLSATSWHQVTRWEVDPVGGKVLFEVERWMVLITGKQMLVNHSSCFSACLKFQNVGRTKFKITTTKVINVRKTVQKKVLEKLSRFPWNFAPQIHPKPHDDGFVECSGKVHSILLVSEVSSFKC